MTDNYSPVTNLQCPYIIRKSHVFVSLWIYEFYADQFLVYHKIKKPEGYHYASCFPNRFLDEVKMYEFE